MRLSLAAVLIGACSSLSGCQGSPVGDALAGPAKLAERDDSYCQSIGAKAGTPTYTQCRMMMAQQRDEKHARAFDRMAVMNAAQQRNRVNCTSTGFGNTVSTSCY